MGVEPSVVIANGKPVGYIVIRSHETVDRTIQVNDGTLVDVDSDGHILGIEMIDRVNVDWIAILADDRFRLG